MIRDSQKNSLLMRSYQVRFKKRRGKGQGEDQGLGVRGQVNLFRTVLNPQSAIRNPQPIACSANNERGYVLIIVMLVIALLFPIVISFNTRTQLNLLQAGNFRDNVQALRLARSGVDGAIGLLKMDDPAYDALTDKWAMAFPTIAVGEGKLTVKVEDEDSKININKLVESNGVNANVYTEQRLRKLITRLGGKQEIVDALIDWMDINSEPFGSQGAEDEYYKALGYYTKNGPLDSLDELYLIKGFDKDLLVDKRLKDYITIAPTDGKINVNTAQIEVLYDIHDEIREGLVDEIIRYRIEKEFKNVTDVKNAIGINDTLYAKMAPYIKVNSTIFTVHSKYTIYKVTKNVDAVLKRDGKNISTISWREY
jgi:general secretion pathway protein K